MSMQLEVTKEAQDQVRELIKAQKLGTAVRVFVQAGGSAGGCGCGAAGCGSETQTPSFGLAFDRPRNGDEVIPVDGFSVVVDGASAPALDGAKIDYVRGLQASGFQVTGRDQKESDPPIGSGCGCGSGGCC